MPEVLSQAEIDALLRGISGGDIPTESGGEKREGVHPFDFANQDRIIRGRMPTLDMVHDRFARQFRSSISTTIQRAVDVTVTGSDMIKFGDFMRSLPLPTSLHLFRMDPLRGLGIFVFDGRLVFSFIDTFFGGSGLSRVKLEGRDFTAIEQRLLKKVVDIALGDYEHAWKAVHPVAVSHVRSEVNPQFVNIVPPSEVVVVISLDLEFEESSGTLTFCLPYSTLEPIRDRLRAGFQSEHVDFDSTWIERLKHQIGEIRVNMRVVLGETEVTGRELSRMKPGDILMLGKDCAEPVTVYVENSPKFLGRVGVHRGSRAVQIECPISTPAREVTRHV
ncbi:MAG: flagellar motor switch protein FliM [Candidatus Sumerlaeia bacterium]|nr:flagellar motor switch protein FliM [Candidatus Sumerlaeia bacterium]